LKDVFTEAMLFPEERIKEARAKWKTALKFLVKKFDSEFMTKALRYKWRPMGEMEIIPLLEGFTIFRFNNEEDLHRARVWGVGRRWSGAGF